MWNPISHRRQKLLLVLVNMPAEVKMKWRSEKPVEGRRFDKTPRHVLRRDKEASDGNLCRKKSGVKAQMDWKGVRNRESEAGGPVEGEYEEQEEREHNN